jgi:lysophospholipase L1-like esterase
LRPPVHNAQLMSEPGFDHSPFAEELRALVRAEERTPPPRQAVLFYGSSSIRLWDTLAEDFPNLPVVNHGFGGSTLADCLFEIQRLVLPIQPRAVVLYAGDNDLDQGASPEHLLSLFHVFTDSLRQQLGAIPLVFISVKPSPSRFWNIANIRHANRLIKEAVDASRDTYFLDIFHLMLNGSERPRPELFTEDGLHMNRDGYVLWTSAVRACLVEIGFIPS